MVEKTENIAAIIPTYREGDKIQNLLSILSAEPLISKILVVDSREADKITEQTCTSFEKVQYIDSQAIGRAHQMNLGANLAKECDVLCFFHADVIPFRGIGQNIIDTLQSGADAGCFAYRFDKDGFWLNINARATKRMSVFTGGGDQGLFIKKSIFNQLEGFDEEYVIMEDFELVRRIQKEYKFSLVPKELIVSARKYLKNSYLKVNLINGIAFLMFYLKIAPQNIQSFYKKWLN